MSETHWDYKTYGKDRFIHYYQQIKHVMKLEPRKILEVGIGDGTVSDFLRRKGHVVRTLDFEPELSPDYLCDVREIDKFVGERFDLVLISEVLEHFKFKYFKETVRKLLEISEHVVISVPYMALRLFDGKKIFTCDGKIVTKIPFFFRKPKIFPETYTHHHWAVGMRGYSKKRIREELENFTIIEEKTYHNTNSIFYIIKS